MSNETSNQILHTVQTRLDEAEVLLQGARWALVGIQSIDRSTRTDLQRKAEIINGQVREIVRNINQLQ